MYNRFASYYDMLMQDADYTKRTHYMAKLFRKYGSFPTLLLDLACGTGGFSVPFAELGCSVIGVDASEEMLDAAYKKSSGKDILYLCQRMENLDLYGTVQGTICCMDSLNHITDYAVLCKVFKRVSLFTEPGGLFIFDVNTPYKHRTILGNNTFVWEEDGLFISWQNRYTPKTRTVTSDLDFFAADENGTYTRTCETVCERAYTENELRRALGRAGFETLAVLGDQSMAPPEKTAERMYFIAKKR
ncbi:MAG: class I SAM-dependent methyltransferase [Clostridia bacterium]|nr:class I SAM-dependent methyltransferase [Clostridia bacterium]